MPYCGSVISYSLCAMALRSRASVETSERAVENSTQQLRRAVLLIKHTRPMLSQHRTVPPVVHVPIEAQADMQPRAQEDCPAIGLEAVGGDAPRSGSGVGAP